MTVFALRSASRLALILSGLLAAGPALAGPPACTCKNLESLQQDYVNELYLEKFFRDLAAELKAWETKELAAKAAGNSDLNIPATSRSMEGDASNRRVKLPFPAVKGYTGPDRVPMSPGSCTQSQADLDALENGSPCEALADVALAHELLHRDICNRLGPDAYWSRMGSELALEEAERYHNGAANLKAEIQRVLDVSDVRLRGEWAYTLTGQGVTVDYFYSFDSGDLNSSAKGGESWTLTGSGRTSSQILKMTGPGLACKGQGALTGDMAVTMTTDGLRFGVGLKETSTGGDLQLRCNGGMAMALPASDASSGTLATSLPLREGDTPIENGWADQIKAMAASNGMTILGFPTTSLSITCAKP